MHSLVTCVGEHQVFHDAAPGYQSSKTFDPSFIRFLLPGVD